MTLKALEMQVAIPRTQDLAKFQEQMHQRPTHEQFLLAQQQLKETERKRKSSEETENSRFEKEKSKGSAHSEAFVSHENGRVKGSKKRQPSWHPYKGKRIDIQL
jgi:NADPH-dependent glutamate synthase beta subunit-like oxidoreductase